jgi:hypothetical protein
MQETSFSQDSLYVRSILGDKGGSPSRPNVVARLLIARLHSGFSFLFLWTVSRLMNCGIATKPPRSTNMSRSPPPDITICILTDGLLPEDAQLQIRSVINHAPPIAVELRLGFYLQDHSFYHVLGISCPDRVVPDRRQLPSGHERFEWTCNKRLLIRAWVSSGAKSRSCLFRQLIHDVNIKSEYVIVLNYGNSLEVGWWEALLPLLEKGTDYIGQLAWHEYSSAELDLIQTFPWYVGVPFDRREGRIGVSYMAPGFMVVRREGLQQANIRGTNSFETGDTLFPPHGSDILLGEIARQLEWKQDAHNYHVKINAPIPQN